MKISGDLTIGGTLSVEGWLHAPNLHHPCRGLYTDANALRLAWPMPLPGWWALVGETCATATVWIAEALPMLPEAEWRDTGTAAPEAVIERVIETVGESPVATDDTAEADLEITDERGRALVQLADGHIRTKNFDSSAINVDIDMPVDTADTDEADFEIADEQGQVVLRVTDGHIYTKRFSSEGGVVPGASTAAGGVSSLNMLFIGNSYSEDCLGYMPMLLQDIVPGFEINLVIAHYSGAKPSQQVDTLNNNYSNYIVYCYDGATKRWSKTHNNASCAAFRNMYRWDVVGYVGFYGDIWENDSRTPSYAVMPYVPQIFDWCRANIPGSWRTAFVLPPPYPNESVSAMETRHEAIRANAKRLMECTGIDDLIPCGTAIQNLRKTSAEIAALGSVNSLTDDGVHLSEGLPVLTTSYVSTLWALRLIGATAKTIRGNGIRPTVEWMDSHNLPNEQRTGTLLGMTEENVTLAQKCALAAFKNPYEANMVY